MSKRRVTVTVDADLLAAAAAAVERDGYASFSEWVNQSMAEKADRDRRLAQMASAIASYEAEHGAISDAELAAQAQADAANTIHVHGRRGAAPGVPGANPAAIRDRAAANGLPVRPRRSAQSQSLSAATA